MKRRKLVLADNIRASFLEALDFARGKKTGAIVHRVMPRKSDARRARLELGQTPREHEPKAMRPQKKD